MVTSTPTTPIVVLIPVYRDWSSVHRLLRELDAVMAAVPCKADVILVNDDALEPEIDASQLRSLSTLGEMQVIKLTRNLGHQRAICIGLVHIWTLHRWKNVVVMDADGEDRAEDVARLCREAMADARPQVIFAARSKRSEKLAFQAGYRAYKLLHRILTGLRVRVGNFSILPACFLDALVSSPETWNHYAAAVYKIRLPTALIETARGMRYSGKSSMNIVSLVVHGISAISVFAENVTVRTLFAGGALVLLSLASGLAALTMEVSSSTRISGETALAGLLLFSVTLQVLGLGALAALLVMFQRSNLGFLPKRDCGVYIRECLRIR